jgi:PGF-pre-PGF domain-containing protein
MVVHNRGYQLILLLLILCAPAYAYINDTVLILAPQNNTLANGTQNLSVEIIYIGTANVTVLMNNTNNASGIFVPLQTASNIASAYNFTFNTTNGSFSDGHYNISIFVQNATNSTDNVTLYISNVTIDNLPPAVSVLTPANRSYVTQNQSLSINMFELGVGVNLSSLQLNFTGATNFTISYGANASSFSCTSALVAGAENTTCTVTTSLPSNNFTIGVSVQDFLNHTEATTFAYFGVSDGPEIINISINGLQVTNNTPASIAINITNASNQVSFNWSVQTSAVINTTTIALLATPDLAVSGTTPSLVLYNLTAGKVYLRINVTLNPTTLSDSVQINLTLNIPLNITAIRANYLSNHGIADFNVTDATGDISNQTTYVNKTINILATVENTTAGYRATFTYNAYGLALRWNATQNAFNFTQGNSSDLATANSYSAGNTTLFIKNTGSPSTFFDNVSTMVAVTVNLTTINRTFYYAQNDGETVRTLLQACASVPTSVTTACYVATANSTTLYLPRFDQLDQVFAVEPSNTILTTTLLDHPNGVVINQSVIPIVLRVVTPFPNETFCSYNITQFNTTNASIPYRSATISNSSFFLDQLNWVYLANLTDVADGRYAYNVTCYDQFGTSSSRALNFTINDTVKPSFRNVNASDIELSSAKIGATADEYATFTVKYGTTPSALTSTVTGNGLALSDIIQINSLSVDTRYYYNVTACDVKNQCNTTGPASFVTDAPSPGAVGGGGGGGATTAAAPSGIEASDGRVWGTIAAGESASYLLRSDLAIKKLELHFSQVANNVKITVRQYKAKPANVPDAPVAAYKYLGIEHVNTENADARTITFAVPTSWITDHPGKIALYRLEGEIWRRYDAQKGSVANGVTTYTATVPGFSFFFIGAYIENAVMPPAQQTEVDTLANTTNVTTAAPVEEQPAEFISDLEETATSSIPAWLVITSIVIIVCVGSVVGLKQYKKYQQQDTLKHQKIREEGERMRLTKEQARPPEHDPMRPVHDYIVKQRAKGMSDEEIRAKLLSVGWDELAVHMELMRR